MDPTPKTQSNPGPILELFFNQHAQLLPVSLCSMASQLVILEAGPDGHERVLMPRRQARGPLA